jgi:hypothetical protein
MRFIIVRPLLLLCAILFLPAFVFAQEAVLTGIITDTTGAVLPGVTVQATHKSSGNTFETVTAAAARPCSNRRISRSPLDWSPDGRFLLYIDDNAPQTGRDL